MKRDFKSANLILQKNKKIKLVSKWAFFKAFPPFVATQARSGDPEQGGAVSVGQFGMRASPYALPNIEPVSKYCNLAIFAPLAYLFERYRMVPDEWYYMKKSYM